MIIDPYAGPGGWSEGLRMLGLSDIGIELDAAACSTRAAAGHRTIRADVGTYPPERFAGAEGVVISPPCQAFSSAGTGEGRLLLHNLTSDIHAGHWDAPYPEQVRHVLEVGRWVEALRPRWLAAEQVPPVLPLWQAYAHRFRASGYYVWAGVLNAANYGVPQTRRRAFLLATLDGPIGPPRPTHARNPTTLFGQLLPWTSMGDALGWAGENQPARTLCGDRSPRWLYPDRDGTHGRVLNRRQQHEGVPVRVIPDSEPAPTLTGIAGAKSQWVWERPATTVCGDPRLSFPGHHDEQHRGLSADEGSVQLTLAEALTIQSFRPDYPVQGNKGERFEQVGNAVPPLLAAHVLSAVTGVGLEGAA